MNEALLLQIELHARLGLPTLRRALRENKRLSLGDVAASIGCTRQAVSAWERGIRTPRGEMLARYVAVLDALRAAS